MEIVVIHFYMSCLYPQGIVVGLEETTFTTTEEDGAFIEVCAIIISPETLERDAVVTLQSADETATC